MDSLESRKSIPHNGIFFSIRYQVSTLVNAQKRDKTNNRLSLTQMCKYSKAVCSSKNKSYFQERKTKCTLNCVRQEFQNNDLGGHQWMTMERNIMRQAINYNILI